MPHAPAYFHRHARQSLPPPAAFRLRDREPITILWANSMGYHMLALFLALTVALVLLSWSELSALPLKGGRRSRRAQSDAQAPSGALPSEATTDTGTPPAEAPRARVTATAVHEDDDAIMARLSELLHDETALMPAAPAPTSAARPDPDPIDDLPVIRDFAAGDALELEIEGPAPRPAEISFEQIGRDALVRICGAPALLLEGVVAATLGPEILKFRSLRLS